MDNILHTILIHIHRFRKWKSMYCESLLHGLLFLKNQYLTTGAKIWEESEYALLLNFLLSCSKPCTSVVIAWQADASYKNINR